MCVCVHKHSYATLCVHTYEFMFYLAIMINNVTGKVIMNGSANFL